MGSVLLYGKNAEKSMFVTELLIKCVSIAQEELHNLLFCTETM